MSRMQVRAAAPSNDIRDRVLWRSGWRHSPVNPSFRQWAMLAGQSCGHWRSPCLVCRFRSAGMPTRMRTTPPIRAAKLFATKKLTIAETTEPHPYNNVDMHRSIQRIRGSICLCRRRCMCTWQRPSRAAPSPGHSAAQPAPMLAAVQETLHYSQAQLYRRTSHSAPHP